MRRRLIVPVVALAAAVAAVPGAAAAAGNGWSCISPFAAYTNSDYDDDPAPNHILDSLAITVERTDPAPLQAVPGQPLALNDLRLRLEFTDVRPAVSMYRRTGGITTSYRGIPYNQELDNARTFSIRPNGDGGTSWFYNAGTSAAPDWQEVNPITVPGEPPKVRDANVEPNTTWYYASPTVALAHRYISHTGNSQFPLDAWVTVRATNTVEGVQTLPVKGYWTVNIQDATPGSPENPANYANDPVTATVPPVELKLPSSRWTPTGAGPVTFSIAEPGNLGIIQIESKGYDRPGYNTPLNVRPYGSVFVRAQTESYGSSNDCIPGTISLANAQIPAGQANLFFGDADPFEADPALGDPATPGLYTTQNGPQKAVGTRGRFAFAFSPPPAIAVAPPAPTATPAATVKRVAFAAKSSLKPTKAGRVSLRLTNPNQSTLRYRLRAATAGKYKVGKRRKVVTVAAAKTIALKPGASTVKLALSKAARSLLAKRGTLRVKLTLTPVGAGSAVTKTITLKRG